MQKVDKRKTKGGIGIQKGTTRATKWKQKEAKFIREASSLRDSRQALFLEKETYYHDTKR